MKKHDDCTFAHIGLNVQNKEEIETWYVKNLDAKIVRSVPGAMSFLADPSGRVILELYENPSAPTLDYGNTHFLTLHIAFLADDPKTKGDELVKAGAVIVDPWRETEAGDQLVMLKDPFGISIQLVKRRNPMF